MNRTTFSLMISICEATLGKPPNRRSIKYKKWFQNKQDLYNEVEKLRQDKCACWPKFFIFLMKMPKLSTINDYLLGGKAEVDSHVVKKTIKLFESLVAIKHIQSRAQKVKIFRKFKKALEECIFINKEMSSISILCEMKKPIINMLL